MREGAVAAYLLSAALALSLACLNEKRLTPRAVALALVAAGHFFLLSANIFFFATAERADSDYFYDRDFGRYWRWA